MTLSDAKLRVQVYAAFDDLAHGLEAGQAESAIPRWNNSLRAIRRDVDRRVWFQEIVPYGRTLRAFELVQQCPLIRHCYGRPRGYPGDAVLLDMIYQHDSARAFCDGLSGVGASIYSSIIEVPACRAVRERRAILAQEIDAAAARNPGVRVLSVACGHMRELELSAAVADGTVQAVVGIDQDSDSLRVAAAYNRTLPVCVTTERWTVERLLQGHETAGKFDVIYAAGLFDYLDDRTAARLTRILFGLQADAGALLVGNFLAEPWEVPFMEIFCDWSLNYRSEAGIKRFARDLPGEAVALRYFTDSLGCVGYLQIGRKHVEVGDRSGPAASKLERQQYSDRREGIRP